MPTSPVCPSFASQTSENALTIASSCSGLDGLSDHIGNGLKGLAASFPPSTK